MKQQIEKKRINYLFTSYIKRIFKEYKQNYLSKKWNSNNESCLDLWN